MSLNIPPYILPLGDPQRDTVKQVTQQSPGGATINNPKSPVIEMMGQDHEQYFHEKAGTGQQTKSPTATSIATGQVGQGVNQMVTQFIMGIDPQNSSGLNSPMLKILHKLLTSGNQSPTASINGILGELQGFLQQFLQNQAQQNPNQEYPTCPIGYIWNANSSMCVPDANQTIVCPNNYVFSSNLGICILNNNLTS